MSVVKLIPETRSCASVVCDAVSEAHVEMQQRRGAVLQLSVMLWVKHMWRCSRDEELCFSCLWCCEWSTCGDAAETRSCASVVCDAVSEAHVEMQQRRGAVLQLSVMLWVKHMWRCSRDEELCFSCLWCCEWSTCGDAEVESNELHLLALL